MNNLVRALKTIQKQFPNVAIIRFTGDRVVIEGQGTGAKSEILFNKKLAPELKAGDTLNHAGSSMVEHGTNNPPDEIGKRAERK